MRRPGRTLSGFVRVIGAPDPGYPGEAGEPWAGEFNAFGVDEDLFARQRTDNWRQRGASGSGGTETLDGTRKCAYCNGRSGNMPR